MQRELDLRIVTEAGKISPEPEFPDRERLKQYQTDAKYADQLLEALRGLYAYETKLKKEADGRCDTLDGQLKALTAAIADGRNRNQRFDELEQWKQELAGLLQKQSAVEERKAALAAARSAQLLGPTDQLRQRNRQSLDAEKTQAARLTQEKQAQEASLPTLERAAKQAREQLPLAEENVRLVKRLESCLKFLEKRQKDTAELERLDRLQTKALEDSNRAEQEYLAVRQAYYRSQSGLLARELREGEPCPVCGATHHPAPAVLQEGGATQEQFQAADDHRKRLEEQLHKISSQTAAARAALETLQKTLQEEGIGDEDTEQSVRQRMKEADAAAPENSGSGGADGNPAEPVPKPAGKGRRPAGSLPEKDRRAGKGSRPAGQRVCRRAGAAELREDEAAYRAACLTAEETERLDGAIRRYEEKKKSLNDRVQEREKQLKDSARADIEALLQQQKAMTEQYRQAQERSRGCDRRLTLHQEAGKAIRRAAEQKKAHAEEWAVLDDLYRAMSGQLSQKVKIAFETYVQQYYFKQVVAAANKRLTRIDRRACLCCG